METQTGRTIPVVRDFELQGSWAPTTPAKPNGPRLGPIYDDGHGGLLSQAWGYTPQNDPQNLVSSYSISNGNNNVWGNNTQETPSLLGSIQLQRQNVEVNRRGLEQNLPHWSSQGRRSVMGNGSNVGLSSYPRFSSWDLPSLPWNNNGVNGNVATLDSNFVDPLGDFSTMSFGDLLGVNNGEGTSNGLFCPGWVSQPQGSRLNNLGMLRNNGVLGGNNQGTPGLYGRGMQNGETQGLNSRGMQNGETNGLYGRGMQNGETHGLNSRGMQNGETNGLYGRGMQNGETQGLNSQGMQNGETNGLYGRGMQNGDTHGLIFRGMQNGETHSLNGRGMQNGATHGLYGRGMQNGETRGLSSRGMQNGETHNLYGRGMQNEAHRQPIWTMGNANLPPRNGGTAFAPETPDSRHRIRSGASENACLSTNQELNEQNVLQEHEVAAAIADLQDHDNNSASETVADSAPAKASKARDEDYNPEKEKEKEKEVNQGIDLNKTPQKKPRKRRYQPKVIRENKPKKTPKPKTPLPNNSKGSDVKRKSVRKNKASTPSAPPPEEAAEPKPSKPAPKTCKKSLHFDMNLESNGCLDGEQANDRQGTDNSNHPLRFVREEESMVKSSMANYDLNRTTIEEQSEFMSLPVKYNLDSSQTDMGNSLRQKVNSSGSLSTNLSQISTKTVSHFAQNPNYIPCASSSEGVETRGSKRSFSYRTDPPYIDTGIGAITQPWLLNHTASKTTQTEILPQSFIPEICKRKRSEMQRLHAQSTSFVALSEEISRFGKTAGQLQVEQPTSKYYYSNAAGTGISGMTNSQAAFVRRSEISEQFSKTWADLSRLKKKRTTWPTRVRDLAPFTGIASAATSASRKNVDIKNSQYPYTATLNGVLSCMEALAADTTATPKSKRKPRKQDIGNNNWNIVLYDNNRSTKEATDSIPALPWRKGSSSIENLTTLFQQLDINREKRRTSSKVKELVAYEKRNQNALVLYEKYGSIVPFEGPFDPIRKRRQRAKVDLDDETTRVWRLLLENIDNEGINGTDEDKANWWDNERSVFQGRVDSFIARMRLVQGDRRFTPWKGSVLDSVIGVFLTQNVSDHLSSSAFMSMAARFPLKPESSGSTQSEATSALFEEPEIYIFEPEESVSWDEKAVDQPNLGRNSRVIFDINHSEEKEVVDGKELAEKVGQISPSEYSSESCQKAPNDSTAITPNSQTTDIFGDDKTKYYATSSQQSVISSQNSVSSQSLKTVGIVDFFSERDSRAQDMTASNTFGYVECTASFMGLLNMAQTSSQTNLQDQSENVKCATEYYQEIPGVSSSNYQLISEEGTYLQDVKGIEMFEEESRSSDISRKDENSPTTEQSNLTSDLTDQDKSPDTFPRVATTSSCYVLEGETMVMQSQLQKVEEPLNPITSSAHAETSQSRKDINVELSFQKVAEFRESNKGLEGMKKENKQVNHNPPHNNNASSVFSDMPNTNPSKTEKGKAGKEKKNGFDWDSLRRDAEINGKKPERPANTRDSVDWEAVRHANVNDIAETIKERGMNNMLAERIKALLDRLVKDHGSTDMEWLRDIPPDKAKEYLLSFRGLGLKSVECIRLLTLHHLAFPVDTNVGRIAVRLGWVPLQPLPESLQLHLLEMYPILESIQKYLWPRLCKLDQKTLYELHYHMITFGKVFCTKRQPNCNACPLRGECRHFASAFASARFSLPGPDEKSIVPAGATTTSNVYPQASNDLLPLTASWGSHTPHSNSNSCDASRNQFPSFPLSLPFPQNVHLERKSINSICEPIVEVPASPEQEPQHEQALCDIEDTFYEDPNEIPTINLNMEEFSQTLQKFMHANQERQEPGTSNAMVALTPEAASIPTPKLKNINRLRTEHYVYELPDTHPLLHGMEKREPDDPCSYLLAIWTPGETANSIDPPARRCSFGDSRMLCNEVTCSYCSSQRESDSQVVRGTLLIPTRTAMRGSFPLNGTYFQVNEVFADHDSSLNPIAVPRTWLWNLPRRTVYFGTSIPTIFKGMNTEDIQHCFWRGYVCVRGFDQKTRAPRPLMARLHFPASRIARGGKGKVYDE